MSVATDYSFKPLTRDNWNDLERLFGKNDASSSCWCMWWHLTGHELNKHKAMTTGAP
ncbi:MAG TPA: hypothetical protein VKA08_19265 [Balneolales bacterium]|nr:hypothetical protein [Balneolales bacterium]